MRSLGPRRRTNAETLGMGPASCALNNPPGDSEVGSYWGTTALPNRLTVRDFRCFCWTAKKLANLANSV